MSSLKEIVTKAVIGKGKKVSSAKYSLETEEMPNTVLGCWVINHHFRGQNSGGKVLVTGSFDINVWYAYDNDTKTAVSTKHFNYDDKMQIHLKDNDTLTDSAEIIVKSLRQPTVTDVQIVGGTVEMNVEKEMGVEIIGDTKVKVNVEDEWDDDYDLIEDEQEIETEIDTTVTDEDFLQDQEER